MGQPEVKLGIITGYGGSQRLARLCGKGVANELCLTGEMISAQEALRIGLVNHVFEPDASVAGGTEALAKKIIANAPVAVKFTTQAIERGAEMPQEEGLFLGGDPFRALRRYRRHARRHAGVSRETASKVSRKIARPKYGSRIRIGESDPGKGSEKKNRMGQSFTPGTNSVKATASAAGLRFAIVVSRFNSFITDRLLSGAVDALEAAGASQENVQVVRVPGAFEIPLAAKKLAEAGRADAIIAVGCILRGETAHFDYVASEVARGVQLAQLDTGVPIIFCVLTCDTLEQAIDRAGLKSGNKGQEARNGAPR